jgi:predicted Ser/Thr protein kinase
LVDFPEELQRNYIIPFSEFSIVKDLGEGNYSQIYLGEWKGTSVALKFCKTIDNTEQFLNEAQIMLYEI